MATTFTGLFVSQTRPLLLAHTGDSRAYLLRDGVLTRETRDDSFVQALVDHGLIAAEAAASHPRRNIITASLAGARTTRSSVVDRDPRPGDRWLLCSDGVTDYLPDDELMRVLPPAPSPEAASARLVASALEAGTRDNVTAVVCDVEHAPTRRRTTADLLRRRRRPVLRRSRLGLISRATGARTTITCASKVRGSGPSSFSVGWPSRTQYSYPPIISLTAKPSLANSIAAFVAGVASGAPAVDDHRARAGSSSAGARSAISWRRMWTAPEMRPCAQASSLRTSTRTNRSPASGRRTRRRRRSRG